MVETINAPPFPLERFKNALVRLKYANCCNEKVATQIAKVMKVARFVTIMTGVINPQDPARPITIEFRVKDWFDFKAKVKILGNAQTYCHCNILYGDFGSAEGTLIYREKDENLITYQDLGPLMNMSWEGFP